MKFAYGLRASLLIRKTMSEGQKIHMVLTGTAIQSEPEITNFKAFFNKLGFTNDQVNQILSITKDSFKSFDCHKTTLLLKRLIISQLSHNSQSSVTQWMISPACILGLQGVFYTIMGDGLYQGGDPWNTLMMIEPVIRAIMDNLPTIEGVNHEFDYNEWLQSCPSLLQKKEQSILEFEIWQEGDGGVLYELLRQERRDQMANAQIYSLWSQKPPNALPNSGRRAAVSIPISIRPPEQTSPAKALGSITNRLQLKNESDRFPKTVTPLEFFFRKLFRLSSNIIKDACQRLSLSKDLRDAIWSLFVSLAEGESHLKLLKGRHLTSILACMIYAVAKLYDQDQSFSQIIQTLSIYVQPYANGQTSEWYRNIPFSDRTGMKNYDEEKRAMGDLVEFYNKVFLPRMKQRIYTLRNRENEIKKNERVSSDGEEREEKEQTGNTSISSNQEEEEEEAYYSEGESQGKQSPQKRLINLVVPRTPENKQQLNEEEPLGLKTPFPSDSGVVALGRNVTLTVSPVGSSLPRSILRETSSSRMDEERGVPIRRISFKGNFGIEDELIEESLICDTEKSINEGTEMRRRNGPRKLEL